MAKTSETIGNATCAIDGNVSVDLTSRILSSSIDAVLLVSKRRTQRYLLFDNNMTLVGWTNIGTGEVRSPYGKIDVRKYQMFAFSGIHVISPRLVKEMDGFPDKFGIIDFYLKTCATHRIVGFVKNDLLLMDIGKLDTLSQAETFLKNLGDTKF